MSDAIRVFLVKLYSPILAKIPLPILLFFSRNLAYVLTPFTSIVKQTQGVLPDLERPWTLRYNRCVARLELHIMRNQNHRSIKQMVSVVNEEHLQSCLRQKRGIIIVSVHHYHCILLLQWIFQYDEAFQPYFIKRYQIEKGNRLHQFHHQYHRKISRDRLIDLSPDLRKTVQILRNKGSLILLQDNSTRTAVPIPFLGRERKMSIGSAKLAEMTDALILPAIASMDPTKNRPWQVRFWKPIDPREKETKCKVISSLEGMIRAYPETWDQWPAF